MNLLFNGMNGWVCEVNRVYSLRSMPRSVAWTHETFVQWNEWMG